MASWSISMGLALEVAIVIVFLAAPGVAITCNDVINGLEPCTDYLKNGSGGPPPSVCCGAVWILILSATTTADKQTVCTCLKNNASENNNYKLELLKSVLFCGIPFDVSTDVDCSKIT